ALSCRMPKISAPILEMSARIFARSKMLPMGVLVLAPLVDRIEHRVYRGPHELSLGHGSLGGDAVETRQRALADADVDDVRQRRVHHRDLRSPLAGRFAPGT